MAADIAYIVFPSSARLRQNSLQFVHNLEQGSTVSQAELVTLIVNDLTDEILQVFMLDLVDLLQLPALLSKVVHGAVGTIGATSRSVTRTVVRKLDNRQMQPLAGYVRDLMLNAPGPDGRMAPFVGFPVSADFHQRARAVVAGLITLMSEVTDQAIDVYITRPTELLQLGLLLRKVVEGGTSIVRSAAHAMIRKMMPDLAPPQLRNMADHIERLLLVNPLPEFPAA